MDYAPDFLRAPCAGLTMRKGGVGRPAHPCGTPLTGAGAQAMDFQNRVGSKVGSGGVASSSETNRARRERLRKAASCFLTAQQLDPGSVGSRCFAFFIRIYIYIYIYIYAY